MKHQPFEPSHFYHLYNRGNNKEVIFKSSENYNYFLRLVKKYLVPICHIYSYCLLPNHFHFIIKVKDFNELPDTIKLGNGKIHQPFSNLFNAYSKAINKENNRVGSLFQEHLKRIKIEDDNYLRNLIVYVNTNPKHHFNSDFVNYNYSSYKSIISKKSTLLKRIEVLEMFDGIDNFVFVHNSKSLNIEALKDYLLE